MDRPQWIRPYGVTSVGLNGVVTGVGTDMCVNRNTYDTKKTNFDRKLFLRDSIKKVELSTFLIRGFIGSDSRPSKGSHRSRFLIPLSIPLSTRN